MGKLMAVNEAMNTVVTEELAGFEKNFEVFGIELVNVMMSFQGKFLTGKRTMMSPQW